MIRLVLTCYFEFLRKELPLARRNFSSIYRSVRDCPLASPANGRSRPEDILRATDLAAILYFKEVKCLQRSASAARLLRKHGFAATLVIGIQHVPFRAHAWVEMNGSVVNDKTYVSEMYSVIERC
jgi:prolyl oligopeptidase